jgi:hypothetical protein
MDPRCRLPRHAEETIGVVVAGAAEVTVGDETPGAGDLALPYRHLL